MLYIDALLQRLLSQIRDTLLAARSHATAGASSKALALGGDQTQVLFKTSRLWTIEMAFQNALPSV